MKARSKTLMVGWQWVAWSVLLLGLILAMPRAHALEVVFDGVSSGEFTDSYTFEFGSSDLDGNAKENYEFWVSGDASAQATVQLIVDPCTTGCGNPAIDYEIYADGQKLRANDDGSYSLTMGDHTYSIHLTGMGSGNNVAYDGSITFTAVSPTPEPMTWMLMLLGLAVAIRYSRKQAGRAISMIPQSGLILAPSRT